VFLNKDEVEELTGYKIKAYQIKALRKMGVHFKVRASDGRPVVHESEFVVSKKVTSTQPDYSWMKNGKTQTIQ